MGKGFGRGRLTEGLVQDPAACGGGGRAYQGGALHLQPCGQSGGTGESFERSAVVDDV